MPVCDVFAECGRAHVQALPFFDETGRTGFASMHRAGGGAQVRASRVFGR